MPDLDLATLRNLNGCHIGKIDVACPLCGPACKTPANRKRKVLRIWDDGEFLTYKCVRCEAHGWARDRANRGIAPSRKAESQPAEPDKAELARYLWSISRPLASSPAASYLNARACFLPSPCIRYLPGRSERVHAMIARFGSPDTALTGVHLTKLNPDGSGKAGTENDKIMIGPSMGQPIIVHDNIEGAELILAEGIEDAASLALATGWAACAVGSAGRLSRVLVGVSRMARVYLAVDADHAGRSALEQCLAVRPDLIPVRLSKCFAPSAGMDANKAIRLHGPDMLLAAIEWCEAQTHYARGAIGFHAMQAAMARMDGLAKASLPLAI